MRSLALLVLILVVSLPLMAFPVYSGNNERYYTYVLVNENYENGVPTINESLVFKLVAVNETAYKVVLVKYNESSMLGRWFKTSIESLLNRTGCVVGIDRYHEVIWLPSPASSTFWLPPSMLREAMEAVDIVNNDKDKVCSLFEEKMSCMRSCYEEYKDNTSARSGCITNCIKKDPLYTLQYVLAGSLSPAMYGLSGVICRGQALHIEIKSITGRQESNLYVFELEAVREPSSTITVKTVYGSNGWLIYYTAREVNKMKNPEGKEVEYIISSTIKLVDTNDDTVEAAMEKTHTGSTSSPPEFQPQSLSVKTEVIVAAAGLIGVIAVVFALKKLL